MSGGRGAADATLSGALDRITKIVSYPKFVVNCFQTLYLWRTANSSEEEELKLRGVVNCFQTLGLVDKIHDTYVLPTLQGKRISFVCPYL